MAEMLKVLVVDDDSAMAQMCAKLIRRRGHLALIAGSCQDALDIVRADGAVDAVITDVQMPHMSGIQLLNQLRELDADLPVILMTGYANIVSPGEAASLGAADYLCKPFDAITLISSLDRAIRLRTSAAGVSEPA